MKRIFTFLFATLLVGQAWAYDFESECSSGQTLYYNITSDSTVEVTYPYYYNGNYYSGYYKPSGNLIIPKTVTDSGKEYTVTSIGANAFYDCFRDNNIFNNNVTIPNSVTTIGDYAFYSCYYMNNVSIPNSVISIGAYAFCDCSSLGSITIPNSVTSIGNNAFESCNDLSYVNIGNSVRSINSNVFAYCNSLTSVIIPNSVANIDGTAFYGCDHLQGNEYDNAYYFGNDDNPYLCLTKAISNNITSCQINDNCKFIVNNAFSGCNNLATISIPNSVSFIGQDAFNNCGNLDLNLYDNAYYLGNNENPYMVLLRAKRTTITSCDIHNDCRIICYNAFKQCKDLPSVTIPNSVISICDYAFSECSMTSVSIPNSVVSIGNRAFYNCDGLTSVTIPNSVIDIGNAAFSDCDRLSSVIIGDSVSNIGNYAFNSCDRLSSVTIGNSVKTIGDNAFNYCNNLTSIDIPESVISISSEAFYNCNGLRSVNIPNSVKTIGSQAFYGCTSLRTIVIPESVTSIESDAFSGFSNIDYVVSKASTPPTLDGDAFASIDTIHVPIDYIDDYKAARIWKWKVILPFYSLRAEPNNEDAGSVAVSDSILFDGDSATISATPNEGYHFVEWSDGSTEANRTINIININNYSFTAIFAINVYVINANNTQHGYIEGLAASYEHGSTTTITARPEGNYRFIRWSDGNTQNPRTITITANLELNAIFEDEHSIVIDAAVPATCTETGLTEGKHCSICGEVIVAQEVVPATGHTVVEGAAQAATCTEAGWTAGSYCSVCGEVIEGRQTIPATGHTKVVDSYTVEPTCTEAGHTESSHCSVCNAVLEEETEIPATGHTVVYSAGMPATCVNPGYTSGSHCSVCGEILSAQTIIPALGHTIVIDPAVPATHLSTGLTQGSHCSVCGQVIVAQTVIPRCVETDTIYIGNSDTVYIVQRDTIYNIVSSTDTIFISTADTIYSIVNNYDTIYSTQIDTVYSVIGKVDTVYNIINKVDTIYNIVNNYDTIYSTQVDTVYSVISKIDTVYNIINKVDTVYNIVNNYDTIYSTQIDTIYNIINKVDTIFNYVNNYEIIYSTQIDTVYNVITKIDTVYDVINKTDTIYNIVNNYDTVYNIVNNYDTIYSTQIDTVYSIITKVDTVYNVINKIDTVYSIINTRDTVFSFASRIDTVFSVINNVDTIYCIVNKTDTIHTHTTDTLYIVNRDTIWLSPTVPCHLYILSNDISMGIVDGGGKFEIGTEASISAVPKSGFRFTQWSDGNLNADRTIILENDVLLMAYFEPIMYTITARSANANMGIAYGSGNYAANSTIEIAALPNYGYHFVRWNDGETSNPRKITVTNNKTFTAEFKVNNYELMAAANEQKMGKVTGAATYEYLSRPQIKATANNGYHFTGWSDGETANPREVLVYSDTTIVALFEADALTPEEAVAQTIDNIMGHIHAIITDDDEMAVNEVNIYAYGNKIIVENATNEIRVYDAMGKLICRDTINRVRTEITINNTGVYIVKTGNVVKRVMVN